jgi:hypothetical protein
VVAYLAADLQDPPNLLPSLLQKWREGNEVVLATKRSSQLGWIDWQLRRLFYRMLGFLSETPITPNATGFGVYDRVVIDVLREVGDPYPFLRGLIPQLGFKVATMDFDQPKRLAGKSKNSITDLYDIAVLGLVKQSKAPMRLVTLIGFSIGALCFLAALLAFVVKMIYWDDVQMGIAPFAIATFSLFGLLFISLGIIGEYILAINEKTRNHPVVLEKERLNF